VSISRAVLLKKEGKRWRMNLMSAGQGLHNGENSDRFNALIRENRRINVRKLSGILNISDGSVKTYQTTPSILESVHPMDPAFVDGQTQQYMAASGAIVVAVRAERGLFLDSVVTVDEMWVHYFTPESKLSSVKWRHSGSPKPKKAKIMFSAGKIMATIFLDSKGVLYVDFLTECHTINAEYYSALLKGPVKTAIKNKRKRVQTSVSFLQDNARPHVAARTMDTIHKLKWKVPLHPPYSPDLAPSDYHLFGPLNEHLGGKRFHNNEEVVQDVQEWVHWQPKDFFLRGIHKLPDCGASVSQTREIMLKSNSFSFRE